MNIQWRSLKHITLALGVAFTVSACGLFENESRYEPVELTEYQPTATGVVVWSSPIGSGSGYGFAPSFSQGSIFAATPDGHVVRVNASTGGGIWRMEVGKKLAGGVGVGEGVVAVTTQDGHVVVLDEKTGKQAWSARTSTTSSTPPVVGNGLVVVRTDDFRVQAFALADGALKWGYVRTNPEISLKANSRMVMGPGVVVVALPAGRLVSLNTANGKPLWDIVAATAQGGAEVDTITDVVGMPLFVDNDVCLASYQGNIVCYQVSHQGSELRWAQPFSSAVGIDATESIVLGAAMNGTVAAFSRQNGQLLWADDTLRNRFLSNPLLFNNNVVVADYEGYAHFYDVNTGVLKGRISLGSTDPIISPLIPTPNGIVAQTGNGHLVLFGVK